MNQVTARLVFAGAFGLAALLGAIALEMMGHECPTWLVALVGAAGGYVFGHAQVNGFSGRKPNG